VLSARPAGVCHHRFGRRETAITSLADPAPGCITLGVDTHNDVHVAAAVDGLGRLLGTVSIPTTPQGYQALLAWARSLGTPAAWGVEGTSSYGAGLARMLTQAGQVVIEVNRPDRAARRPQGKSDPVDAVAAARAVLAGRAAVLPKAATGPVEAIRALRVARAGASRPAPPPPTPSKACWSPPQRGCASSCVACRGPSWSAPARPCPPAPPMPPPPGSRPPWPRSPGVSRPHQRDHHPRRAAWPTGRPGRPTAAGPLWRGHRLGGCAAGRRRRQPHPPAPRGGLAALCGASPVQASSGKTVRHRLNRGGNRQANAALYRIVVVRLRHDPRTQAYMARRLKQGKTRREVIRCLKRYLAREIYAALLPATIPAPTTP